jgi:hypothetical protein
MRYIIYDSHFQTNILHGVSLHRLIVSYIECLFMNVTCTISSLITV